MKVYLSLPITGYKLEERIAYAQQQAERVKKIFDNNDVVCDIFNPLASVDPNNPQKSHAYYMGKDLYELSLCDTIILCPGWASSEGCKEEYWFARHSYMSILEMNDEGWVRHCKYELDENE